MINCNGNCFAVYGPSRFCDYMGYSYPIWPFKQNVMFLKYSFVQNKTKFNDWISNLPIVRMWVWSVHLVPLVPVVVCYL